MNKVRSDCSSGLTFYTSNLASQAEIPSCIHILRFGRFATSCFSNEDTLSNIRPFKSRLPRGRGKVTCLLKVSRSAFFRHRTSIYMSLYYDAASMLSERNGEFGSLKSRVFGSTNLKSKPIQVFALVSEASKWSFVLKGVIEKSQLLLHERKVRIKYLCFF